MRNGFTLVELSIVLVIIGLLVGGILVGQSLIKSAKINKEVQKLSQYSIAIVNFRQKFKQEAGDSIYFSVKGNNNGVTGDVLSSCPTWTFENYIGWVQLSEANMIKEKYTWPAIAPHCSGWNESYAQFAPTNKDVFSGTPTYLYQYGYNKAGMGLSGYKRLREFYTIYDADILWALENKLDDGIPSNTSGTISSNTPNALPCTVANIELEVLNNDESFRRCGANMYFSSSPEMPLLAN